MSVSGAMSSDALPGPASTYATSCGIWPGVLGGRARSTPAASVARGCVARGRMRRNLRVGTLVRHHQLTRPCHSSRSGGGASRVQIRVPRRAQARGRCQTRSRGQSRVSTRGISGCKCSLRLALTSWAPRASISRTASSTSLRAIPRRRHACVTLSMPMYPRFVRSRCGACLQMMVAIGCGGAAPSVAASSAAGYTWRQTSFNGAYEEGQVRPGCQYGHYIHWTQTRDVPLGEKVSERVHCRQQARQQGTRRSAPLYLPSAPASYVPTHGSLSSSSHRRVSPGRSVASSRNERTASTVPRPSTNGWVWARCALCL